MGVKASKKPTQTGFKFLYSGVENTLNKDIFCKTATNGTSHEISDECQLLEIYLSDTSLKIINVYRSQKISISTFEKTLIIHVQNFEPTVILGDLNINSWSISFRSLEQALNGYNYQCLNHLPTHRKGSCIDYVFVRKLDSVLTKFSVPYSDHDVLKCSLNL